MKIKYGCLLLTFGLNDAIEHSSITNTTYVRKWQFILRDVTEANANIQRKLDHILFSQILMASSLTKPESFLLLSIDFWETDIIRTFSGHLKIFG